MPEVCPSFYGSTSDTVWMRNSKHNSLFQRGDSIRFPLSRELPQDKDLVVDCLEFFLHKARDTSGLTIELYLDNRKVVGIPYTFAGITRLDLKSLNISEKDRTLSYRKNLMVKFKKNGSSYGEMGIGYASPGLPAGHVKGRLQVRNRLLPQSTCQYLTDHNKNITGLADAQGKIVATWDYDAFGNIIQQTGTLAKRNPLRFSSEYHDEDLGLIYYNYRHYNPREGRWISRDPIEEKGGLNLHEFVKNSALIKYDILGQKLEKWDYSPDAPALEFVEDLPDNIGGRTLFSCAIRIEQEPDPQYGNKSTPVMKKHEGPSLRIMINKNLGGDANTGNHSFTIKGHNQTTEKHERHHAKLYIDEWNSNYESVNKYEISVCRKCYSYQESIVQSAFERFVEQIKLKNYDFDSDYSSANMTFSKLASQALITSLTDSISIMETLKKLNGCA